MRKIWVAAAVLCGGLWLGLVVRAEAQAEERHVALVIGNSAYTATSPLRNPVNDAREMEKLFKELGFNEVRVLLDADQAQMLRALNAFANLAREADVAVVFYSGHGMELEGGNYLIPVDAALKYEKSGRDESVSLDHARRAASGARRLSMVIVDACRNNSFPTTGRSGAKGMRPVSDADRLTGEVVVYSTAPGRIALDGTGDLSPFTEALVRLLRAGPNEDARIWPTRLSLPNGQRPHMEAGGFTEKHVALLASGGTWLQPPPIAPPVSPAAKGASRCG